MAMESNRKVPLCRAGLGSEEIKAATDVISSGWLTAGPKVAEFERSFAAYLGVRHAVCVNSCTAALFLALAANGVRGEVILPSFTFVASANAVSTAGATPVFADIEPRTRGLDPSDVERRITPRTEALMAVHYGGHPCDMEALKDIADRHGLLLVEDSAETLGGEWRGRKAGTLGAGCFSFFPTKNITTGEGGMLTTDDDVLERKARTLMAHGIERSTYQREGLGLPWYREAVVPGYNFRMSDVLAAIGLEQMKKLEAMNVARREHSRVLTDMLDGLSGIELPEELPGCRHVYQMFTVLGPRERRDALVSHLKAAGVEANVHFVPPVHRHEAYRGIASDEDLPVTCEVAERILTLPMFPDMVPEDLTAVAGAVRSFFESGE